MKGNAERAEDVVVVGAGPAGVAATVQLVRQGLRPVVFERGEVGGMVWNARLIENYPGFPDGVGGPDMARLLEQELDRVGVRAVKEDVLSLDYADGLFVAETAARTVAARAAVVASGTMPRTLNEIELAPELTAGAAAGASAEVSPDAPPDAPARVLRDVYPLWRVSGARVAVVGAGDAAYDYALNLSERNEVTLLSRGDTPSCLPLLSRAAEACDAIDVRSNTSVLSARPAADGSLELSCSSSDAGFRMSADYLVVAIGREPADGFLSERLVAGLGELEADGVFAFAGDVRSGIYRQTAIAAGQGVKAGMVIARRLGGDATCAS